MDRNSITTIKLSIYWLYTDCQQTWIFLECFWGPSSIWTIAFCIGLFQIHCWRLVRIFLEGWNHVEDWGSILLKGLFTKPFDMIMVDPDWIQSFAALIFANIPPEPNSLKSLSIYFSICWSTITMGVCVTGGIGQAPQWSLFQWMDSSPYLYAARRQWALPCDYTIW